MNWHAIKIKQSIRTESNTVTFTNRSSVLLDVFYFGQGFHMLKEIQMNLTFTSLLKWKLTIFCYIFRSWYNSFIVSHLPFPIQDNFDFLGYLPSLLLNAVCL